MSPNPQINERQVNEPALESNSASGLSVSKKPCIQNVFSKDIRSHAAAVPSAVLFSYKNIYKILGMLAVPSGLASVQCTDDCETFRGGSPPKK